MNRFTQIFSSVILCAMAGSAFAADTGSNDTAQAASNANSGSHSTDATDRGGKPDGNADHSVTALLDWLLGRMD